TEVARYFLLRGLGDGDTISPLRMQKLVYYAYVYTLVKNSKKLFGEQIQAWKNGPVVPSLYSALKCYGSMPIPEEFLGELTDEDNFDTWINGIFPEDVVDTLDGVYQTYMAKTPFELVMLTHSELPWRNARKGLSASDSSTNAITDEDILAA